MIAGSGGNRQFLGSNTGPSAVSVEPLELQFIPVSRKGSGTVSADNLFSVSSGKPSRDLQLPDILKMMDMDSPILKNQKIISSLNELITKAGGDIVLKEHKGAAENIDAITVSPKKVMILLYRGQKR
jgi:hypothetical protein